MHYWNRLIVFGAVLLLTLIIAWLIDRRMSRRDLPPAIETRYRILRRSVVSLIVFVGLLSGLLVIPPVRAAATGILASSEHKAEAEEFIDFLVSEKGQQAIADSYALEYPLNPAVTLALPVKPFDELDPPDVDVSDLNGPQVIELMQEVGFL